MTVDRPRAACLVKVVFVATTVSGVMVALGPGSPRARGNVPGPFRVCRCILRGMAATARKTPSADVTKVRRGQIQQMRSASAAPSTTLRAAVERRTKTAGR